MNRWKTQLLGLGLLWARHTYAGADCQKQVREVDQTFRDVLAVNPDTACQLNKKSGQDKTLAGQCVKAAEAGQTVSIDGETVCKSTYLNMQKSIADYKDLLTQACKSAQQGAACVKSSATVESCASSANQQAKDLNDKAMSALVNAKKDASAYKNLIQCEDKKYADDESRVAKKPSAGPELMMASASFAKPVSTPVSKVRDELKQATVTTVAFNKAADAEIIKRATFGDKMSSLVTSSHAAAQNIGSANPPPSASAVTKSDDGQDTKVAASSESSSPSLGSMATAGGSVAALAGAGMSAMKASSGGDTSGASAAPSSSNATANPTGGNAGSSAGASSTPAAASNVPSPSGNAPVTTTVASNDGSAAAMSPVASVPSGHSSVNSGRVSRGQALAAESGSSRMPPGASAPSSAGRGIASGGMSSGACTGSDCAAVNEVKSNQFAAAGALGPTHIAGSESPMPGGAGGGSLDGLLGLGNTDTNGANDPTKGTAPGLDTSLAGLDAATASLVEEGGSTSASLLAAADGVDIFARLHQCHVRAQKRGLVIGMKKKL